MAGVLQHLRSSTLNKRPNPASMVDGQIAINYASGSPGAFFKDSNGNLVKVGPVHVGATAPNVSPASGGTAGNSLGEQWLDTSGGTYVFKIWDGAAWRSEAGEFVNVTGDTMTGSLTLGPSANLIFEGSTDDGFETTLTVVDPTADRTITLPNVSGTVVTTGDSGTVTSTMIADGAIVNADVNTSAAIAGTKISPDFGSQNIATTGTATAASFIPSSSSVPSDGLYLPSSNNVAISTNGTERMRITNSGVTRFGNSNSTGINASSVIEVYNTGTLNAIGARVSNDAFYNFVGQNSTGTTSFYVEGDGDVKNTNNSYGAISDAKLKENVADASTQWDDIKYLQVRKYNFKPETGYGTHIQIGLIAQEVELVSPGLVSETPDCDEDGNDLGTVTKSVNYSVLYMKAVKALQEAMERIEQLETEMAAVKAKLP